MTPLASLLAEVRALAEKATPGPWEAHHRDVVGRVSPWKRGLRVAVTEFDPHGLTAPTLVASADNAAFIVALVNLWPRLLAIAEGEPGADNEAIRAALADGGVMGSDVVKGVRLVVRERARFSREAQALRVAVVSMEAAANLHALAARVHDGTATSEDATTLASVATSARDAMATLEEAWITLPDTPPTEQDRARASEIVGHCVHVRDRGLGCEGACSACIAAALRDHAQARGAGESRDATS